MDAPIDAAYRPTQEVAFLRRTLIVGGVGLLLFIAWRLSAVFLLAFGAVIVAALLHALGDLLSRVTRLPHGFCVLVAGFVLIGAIGGGVYLLGSQATAQFSELATRLAETIRRLEVDFGVQGAAERLIQQAREAIPGSGLLTNVAGVAATVLAGLANALLIIFGAVYLAAEPKLYREGVLKLVPPSQRTRASETVDAAGRALRLWLVGQLLAMLLVGGFTTAGLIAIGMPSSIALGVIAGLFNFVPFVGPVASAVPALLIAASIGPEMILWTLGLYVIIQQVEGNFITPMIERRVVSIPPALAIFAIVAMGVLLGPLGIVFGAPLTVVVYVAVKKLYLRETLGEPTSVPGEKNR